MVRGFYPDIHQERSLEKRRLEPDFEVRAKFGVAEESGEGVHSRRRSMNTFADQGSDGDY